jgi:hypothetical protein
MPYSSFSRAAAAALLLLVSGTGCYHYHVLSPEFDPATEPQRKTVHSLAWGLANKPGNVFATNCEASDALDQVSVTSNFGYSFITAVTLGFWAPLQVEWRCAKPPQEEGFIGLEDAVSGEVDHARR